jgi:hypothetical protein
MMAEFDASYIAILTFQLFYERTTFSLIEGTAMSGVDSLPREP